MTWLAAISFLKRIPWQVWAGLALIALFLWFRAHYIGIGLEHCQKAQEAAEAKSAAKGKKASEKAHADATAIKIDVRRETQDAAAEVRKEVDSLPATCPPQPPRVRELGQEAVASARASLPAAPNR